jgi:tetratricopeptide (TPR) repeat protein
MHRLEIYALGFVAMLAVAPVAQAQAPAEPPHTKELKEAERFIASAMTTSDTTEKRVRYERALNPIQQALAASPENARVWMTAGEVYSALHDFNHADSAFTRAQALYPKFADEIASDRLSLWADAFNSGVALMDQGKNDEAIAMLETAERLYSDRPESKMNLGVLYANKSDAKKAVESFRSAIALMEGPAKEKIKPEEAANWKRFIQLARLNIAQIEAQRGVTAFDEKKFEDAIVAFRAAHDVNPYARDYSYNLAQSIYAKASALEAQRAQLLDEEKAARAKKDLVTAKAKADSAAALSPSIIQNYGDVEPLVAEARKSDPNNEDLFSLQARSFKIRSELAADAAQKAEFYKHVDDLLKLHDAMAVELQEISVATNTADAAIKGKVRNRKLAANTPVKIHFALVGLDGNPVGEQDVTVNAPAIGEAVPFEMTIKTTADVAGWRYTIQ